jgi:putative aminopeptidase FrvX
MITKTFYHLAGRLLRHPAAPYHEHAVRAEVERICAEQELEFERDQFGNVLVKLRTAPKLRPIALAAHLDHPGFEIIRKTSDRGWLARFWGGVPPAYFRPGVPVLLMPGRELAKLGRTTDEGKKAYVIRADKRPTDSPQFAAWALEDFVVRQGKIHARACDDLIGVASALATLIELKRSRARVHVLGVFSRAEEVGFQGALALAANRGLPQKTLVISLETSRELPGVKMGRGVILRVGDRASIFDSQASRFLVEVANDLNARKPRFQFQRGLMSGGTCEATAYQEYGFQSAAVCVALGNYHNCGEGNRIRAEYVSVADACTMVDLLVAAAKAMPRYAQLTGKLPQRLSKLLRQGEARLRRSTNQE